MSFFKKLFGFGKKSEKKTASLHSHTSPKNGNLMLALEERFLYDAAGLAVAFEALTKSDTAASDHHVDSDHTEVAEKSLADIFKDAVPQAAQKSSEIVFVDPSVTDYQKIIESVSPNAQVIILDPNKDGVAQISEVLSQQTDVKAVHIVSHGSDASLTLGNTQLSKDTIENYAPMLSGWKDNLSQGADILIYGCEVAKGADGKAFTDRISQLTGADTAASDDITGAADKGGDWVLEYQPGWIDAKALSPKDYKYELDPYTVNNAGDAALITDTNSDGNFDSDGSGGTTLREAVAQANEHSGADTISFSISSQTITLTSTLDITDTVTINTATNKIVINSSININGNNKATFDGTGGTSGIFSITAGTVGLNGLTIQKGSNTDGGGIYVDAGTVNITNSTISTNTATNGGGGGIYSKGTLSITGCTFDTNTAYYSGGGIRVQSGSAIITNSTFFKNTSGTSGTGGGGAIYVDNTTSFNVSNSTIYDNTAKEGGGIRIKAGTPVTVNSSIIAGNTAQTSGKGADADIDTAVSITAQNNYIKDATNGSHGITNDWSPTNLTGNVVGTDPGLDTFDYHGGVTKVWSLKSTSSVINKGFDTQALGTDQRGATYNRVYGDDADIGAYEYYSNDSPSFNSSTTTTPSATYNEDDPAVKIDNNITLTDADSSRSIVSAVIKITTNYESNDVLVIPAALLPSTLIATPSAGQITLTPKAPLTKATAADFSTAIAAITFENTSDNPGATTRTIEYTATDNETHSATFTRTVEVKPVNDAPVLDDTDAPDGTGASVISLGSVFVDATDPAGIKVSNINISGTSIFAATGGRVTDPDLNATFTPKTGIAITGVNNSNDGTWQYKLSTDTTWTDITGSLLLSDANALLLTDADYLRFVPTVVGGNPAYSGSTGTMTQAITFRAWDQSNFSSGTIEAGKTVDTAGTSAYSAADATADITVTAGNVKPTANDDSESTYNKPVTIKVLDNDSDDGGLDTATVDLNPSLAGKQTTFTVSGQGTFEVDTAGIVKFTPDASFSGTSIDYTVNDNMGSTSNKAKITINKSANQAPTANADSFIVVQNSPAKTFDVLANDSDPESDNLTITGNTDPANGSVSIASDQKSVQYKPDTNYFGPDSFTYTISDGKGNSSTATVSIYVKMPGPDQPPVTANDSYVVVQNQAKVLYVLSNDSDPDIGDRITPHIITAPTLGTASVNNDGTITYFSSVAGNDMFTYYVTDLDGLASGYAVVTITVDEPLVAADDTYSVKSGETINFSYADLTGNDTNPKDYPLTVAIYPLQTPKHGSLTDDTTNHKLSYTANNYTSGQDQFVYTIAAQNGSVSQGTVRITIIPKADPVNLAVSASSATAGEGEVLTLPQITASLNDTSGGETLAIKISGLPSGATLSNGYRNSDGSWTLRSDQLSGLTLSGTSNFSGRFTLTVEATATETANGDTSTSSKTIDCNITSVADTPVWTLDKTSYSGVQDTAIALDITMPQLSDADGSEYLSDITISGVPTWITFNKGTNNGNGIWTFSADQLNGLSFTASKAGSATLNLKVSSVERDNGDTATTEENIDVGIVPALPTLTASDASGDEDTAIPLSIAVSLDDPTGTMILGEVIISGVPDGATLSQGMKDTDGTWILDPTQLEGLTITPPKNSGDDMTLTASVTVWDIDGNSGTSEKQFTIDVIPQADPPILTVFSPVYGVDEIVMPLNISTQLTDTDGSEALTIMVYDLPEGATLSGGNNWGADGWNLTVPYDLQNLTLTVPDGTPSFTLRIRAISTEWMIGDEAYTEKTIDVALEPVAVDDAVNTDPNTAVTFDPLDNDKGYELTLESYDTPAHGTLSKDSEGNLTYTPDEDYVGTDSFEYTIVDGLMRPASATVTVVVGTSHPPEAIADTYTVFKNTEMTIPAASGVLANDTDADGDALTAVKVSDPANGTLTLNEDGSFTYKPNKGFVGTDTFTYKANDGKEDSLLAAEVTITVKDVDLDAADDEVTVRKNSTVTINPLDNDSLPSGTTVDKITLPAHGILADNGDGTYLYQPETDYVGDDSFTYTLLDSTGKTDTATVNITVRENIPPVAVDDTGYSTDKGKTLTISAKGVLTNDTDADDDTLTAVKVTDPANGTLSLNADGSFTYTPNAGFVGTDTFTYKANDGTDDSATAVVTITVRETTVTANNDTYTTSKNQSITIDPFSNDTPDTVITFETISPDPNGRLVDNMDGTYLYTPAADFVGQEVFTYTISDGSGNISNPATITIDVTDNTPPVANADVYSTNQGQVLTVNAPGVLSNDTDANSDALTAVKVSDPANGTLTFNTDGSFTYTPNAGFIGADTFTYKANDGKADSAAAVVTITVGNRAPVAVNDSVTTNQDTAAAISFSFLMQNDSDPDGNTIGISPDYTMPANGRLEKTADSFIYTPNTGYYGSDSFTYTISDGKGGTASATVNITVNQIGNRNPVAVNDAVSTDKNTPVTISFDFVKQNDYDPDGDPITVATGASVPVNGTIAIVNNAFVYTPNTGFVGTDSFIYNILDGKGGSASARVNITVNEIGNRSPNAADDAVSTLQGTPITIGFGTLIQNDTDADGDALSVSPDFTMPANGSLVRNGDSFVYTPNTGFTGTDSFTYIVSDGKGGSDSAKVTITVYAPYVNPGEGNGGGYSGGGGGYVPTTPTTPVVAADDSLSVFKNTTLNFKGTDILANDQTDGSRDLLSIASFTQPSHGTVVRKADGTYAYVPSQNYTGSDSFTYTVSDGQTSSTAKVNISVLEPAGIIANDDAISVKGSTRISADTLLANDKAINTYDRLTISGFTQPSHGILVDNGDNTFTYTADSGYIGSDSFTYTITDGKGNKASATVRLNVGLSDGTDTPPDDDDDDTDTNHSPVVADDHLNATQDSSMTFTASQILANDTDADNDVLSISGIEQPYDGTLADNGNGTYTYTPDSGFTGEDSFAYTISDGKGGTATGVIYVNVSSKDIPPPDQDNHAPVGVDDTLSTRVNTQLSIVKDTLVRNDGDPDGDTLSVSAFTQPTYGTITDKGDGTLTYTPLNSFTGQDSFTYTVADGKGGTSSAKVTVYVNKYGSEQKIFPDAIDDEVSTSQNVAITITGQTMLANDKEPQGNPLMIIGYTQAYNGTVVKDSSGNYVYTPNSGFTGRDIFSYTVSNGKGGTDTAWVRITIGSSATRSADSVRRSAGQAETSDVQSSNNSATDASRPLPAPEPIVVPADSSVTVTPIVVAASVSESEEQSLTLPQDGTPYQKESYVSVSGQTVFDVKADKNYQEWIRTAVYDRNDILAANYGGGDSAEIIRYQAYLKARESDNPSLWKDRNTSADIPNGDASDTVDKRIVASDTSEKAVIPSSESDVISSADIIGSLFQQADMNTLSFSEQIQVASGGFDTERTDFLSRLGALL